MLDFPGCHGHDSERLLVTYLGPRGLQLSSFCSTNHQNIGVYPILTRTQNKLPKKKWDIMGRISPKSDGKKRAILLPSRKLTNRYGQPPSGKPLD
jgi:hypothetical protein